MSLNDDDYILRDGVEIGVYIEDGSFYLTFVPGQVMSYQRTGRLLAATKICRGTVDKHCFHQKSWPNSHIQFISTKI
ncbi:MAG: hypothetical protein ACXVCP_07505 [Bdellovibrio sp.]